MPIHPPRPPWSNSELLRTLVDQALLARHCTRRGEIEDGWPDDKTRLERYEHDAFWLAAIVPAFLDVILDECDAEPGCTVDMYVSDLTMTNRALKVGAKLKIWQSWFVSWGCQATMQALGSSPYFSEPFFFGRWKTEYRFERTCVTRLSNEDAAAVHR
jgi:hypothetical protein